MKTRITTMLKACFLTLPAAAILMLAQPAQAETIRLAEDIKVQVNESLVHFTDAQPFLDENHKLQVPARDMSDKLGYQLQWEHAGDQLKLTLSSTTTTVIFTTGDPNITVNGQTSVQEAAAKMVNGRVYIPFRLLADSFGITTQWDNLNRIAILGVDGQYHAPAWYRPTKIAPLYTMTITAQASAYTAAPAENGTVTARDYMGNPLQLGTIAVDPAVIPLGSKVFIDGYTPHASLPPGGLYAIATDIGGSVKGNKIDIYLPQGRQAALNFGLQHVKVHVLGS
ncbi:MULTISPECIES: stalk domain-containing protein [Paenibacillus]|uniref:stalk domain-containing protein n=1 Tax=Paenibacillus TaxID=44249 RepID=UPI0022B8DB9B|nr:stalk domain-containing protein [Paenibacillus caseinilyticus]MCZ8519642.1 stalk domain-containing protein [Paenibacillus caseinilyticus]